MKEIIVNKECYVNQDNIIKSKEWLDIAVSVLAVNNENTNEFIHFCLAMDSDIQCCEHFGTGLIKNTPYNIEYVSKIKFYDTLKDIETYNFDSTTLYKLQLEIEERDIPKDNCLLAVIFGKDNEILSAGYAFNLHNGYYAHEVKILENNKIEVTYL